MPDQSAQQSIKQIYQGFSQALRNGFTYSANGALCEGRVAEWLRCISTEVLVREERKRIRVTIRGG